MIAALLLASFLLSQMNVWASGVGDINDPAVFLKQNPGDQQCTLVAATMMIRRSAILAGDTDWKSITASAVYSVAWRGGLLNSFSYGIYSVINEQLPGGEKNKAFLIAALKKHPEGVAIYKKDAHAVLLTDYTDGVFYCADPAGSRALGRIPISQAYKVTIENATSYWHMKSQVILSDGTVNPVYKYSATPSPSYTPDPSQYKVAYSRSLSVSSTAMSGSDVKYVQACLHYLGYDVTIDGKYGPATSLAVTLFQKSKGLTVDGKCGPATWAALEKAIADTPAPLRPEDVTVTADKAVLYPSELVTLTAKSSKSIVKHEWYFKKAGQSAWTLWANHATAVTSSLTNSTWNGIQFYCRVTDKYGNTADSNTIKLSVIPRPDITAQPSDIVTKEGYSAAFSVIARGCGLKYQWYYKKHDATAWSIWNGHTEPVTMSTVNASWNGMKVYCRITDARGTVLRSSAASITVKPTLRITSQPQNLTIARGSTVTISLKATGSGLKYQWYLKKKDDTSYTAWVGRTGPSEVVTPNDTWNGIQLYCLIKDSDGDSVKSNVITVTLTTPKIVTQPVSKTIASGDSVTVSLKATGTGLTYQWYYKKKGETSFSVWTGRTGHSEVVTPNDTWNGIQLYCLVKDSAGNSVKSDTVTITIQ